MANSTQNRPAFLFDLDGVLIDTESQYDIFWNRVAENYGLGIAGFAYLIKGVPNREILTKYFPHCSPAQHEKITADLGAFEQEMDPQPIAGAWELLSALKAAAFPIGLVTSSSDKKLWHVFARTPLQDFFGAVVSSDRITRGKPDPMCYLLAAKDLDTPPENCWVFEDSLNGIASGNAAGMRVIGLATTYPASQIAPNCHRVIPDFSHFDFHELLAE